MARITKAIREAHGFTADAVPADIRKSIDQEELLDRVAYAKDLSRKARTARDSVLRKGYADLARAMMRARPRAEIQREYAERVAKARGLGNTGQAAAIRAEAQDFLDANPVAPRRAEHADIALAKAKAPEGMVIVYDATGKAVGLVDPSRIQPVADPSDIAEIQKAADDGLNGVVLRDKTVVWTGDPAELAKIRTPGKARRAAAPPRRTPGQGWPPRSR